ncbi:MAG: hypothetical protein LBK50_00910 [Candidatus Nomurabacteria bacterium]|jgi:hypothetical protein|nr:hypothetical protein [Candidatus Nomurabacteria bacterium]
MDLIKSQSKKSVATYAFRVFLELSFVAVVLLSIIFLHQPIVAVALVLLYKWRIFFVRPRFWWANILSNLTDVIFGLSIVAIICYAPNLWVQIAFAAIYALWNIFLKPKSKHGYVAAQAAISQFFGIWALSTVAHTLWLPIVVLGCFVIGFSVMRHVLMDYEEDSRTLLAMIWGVILAEVGFFAFHWTLSYDILGVVLVPQVAILDVCLGAIFYVVYDSYKRNEGAPKWEDIRWPVVFSTLLITVISVIFSGLF